MLWGVCISLSPVDLKAESLTVCASPELTSGAVLLADESLRDPSFSGSVVLLTKHGPGGAAGVILNRPSIVRVLEALPMLRKHLPDREQILYFGGPVAANRAFALASTNTPTRDAIKIIDNLYILYEIPKLLEHLSANGAMNKTRFYTGYAGWGPKQLEAEIKRGDWLIIDYKSDAVFSESVDTLWQDLRSQCSGSWVLRLRPNPVLYSPRKAPSVTAERLKTSAWRFSATSPEPFFTSEGLPLH